MSCSAEIVIESIRNALLIPSRASLMSKGKPAVWVQQGDGFVLRQIEVGKRNDTELVVTKGLKAGEVIAMEDPNEVAKRAKKL